MKTFEAPQGKYVTVVENGVELEYVPGKEYSDDAEGFVTEKIDVVLSCPMDENKPFPYRAGVYVDENGIDEKKSVTAVIQGGELTNEGLTGAKIEAHSADFDAVIVNGGKFALRDVKIAMPTESNGKKICDFAGLGAAVAAFSGGEVRLDNCEIETTGVGKSTLYADNGADIVAVNCKLTAMGGEIYAGYSRYLCQKLV